ncbi:MAG TPA: hypothetical protein GXX75_13995 [Clostridiales bacterium]|nr:hypothetical protein [Clostridiales bacterium]
MNKVEQFRYDVLERLRNNFDALGEAAILRDPMKDIPTHMLNVLHTELGYGEEEVMGEYYFLPLAGENKYHLFSSVLTLTEEMPDNRYDILGQAANALNFFLPVGSLVFSRAEGIMAYKYTSLIPVEATIEEALKVIDGNIGLSLHIVDQYVDQLMKLMQGDIEWEDFLDILPEAYRS